MRVAAAVFEKLCTPLSVTEVEIDEPGAGEALVKIVATGVCHTDALARDGDMPFPAPGVLGHEGAGIVEAVGAGVTNVAVGDKVVGILGGEGRSESLINTLITLNKQGRFPYGRLIQTFPLDQVNEALEASHSGDVVKPVLRMPE
jgi:Zn-dependent alcohol dehydrogenase